MRPKSLLSVFLFLLLLFMSRQSNSQDVSNSDTTRGWYNGEYVLYHKKYITVYLDQSNLASSSFQSSLTGFLSSFGSILDTSNIEYVGLESDHYQHLFREGIIILSDTSNSLNYIDLLINSGYFIQVDQYPVYLLQSLIDDPNDPYYTSYQQWYLRSHGNHDIKCNKAWWVTKGSNNPRIRIFIMDSGIRMSGSSVSHEDLNGATNIVLGRNYTTDANLNDGYGHGTPIAGLITATKNNGVGIAGMIKNCEVEIDKTVTDNGMITSASLYNCVDSIVAWKKRNTDVEVVVNMSFASTQNDGGLHYQMRRGDSVNIVFVCSSGNSAQDPNTNNRYVLFPARFASYEKNIIAVGATDSSDIWSSYSNYSQTDSLQLTCVAPGGYGAFSPHSSRSVSFRF